MLTAGAALMETPRFRGMNSELDNWMEWIDNQMSEDAFDPPTIDDLESFIGGKYIYGSVPVAVIGFKIVQVENLGIY